MSADMKAAMEWAAKYEKVQGDSTLGNFMRAFLEVSAELEQERKARIKWQRIRTPTHGTCCTCQACGLDYDSCRCDLDEVADRAESAEQRAADLQERLDRVEQVCNDESRSAWDKYKFGGPAEQGNPYWEGFSDGAEQVLASFASTDAGTPRTLNDLHDHEMCKACYQTATALTALRAAELQARLDRVTAAVRNVLCKDVTLLTADDVEDLERALAAAGGQESAAPSGGQHSQLTTDSQESPAGEHLAAADPALPGLELAAGIAEVWRVTGLRTVVDSIIDAIRAEIAKRTK